MRYLSAVLAFGLMVAAVASQKDAPVKEAAATLTVVGEFTADKDTTLNYTLKRNGKVVAEEKGLKAFPGKTIDVPAADAGPYELTLTTTGTGVVKVQKLGLSAVGNGKSWKGDFGGQISDLNAKDARGFTVTGITLPITLAAARESETTAPIGPAGGNSKNDGDKADSPKRTNPTLPNPGGGNAKNGGGAVRPPK